MIRVDRGKRLCYNAQDNNIFVQSRIMCVKCLMDGELPSGRKGRQALRYIFRIPLQQKMREYLLLYAE